MNRMTILKIAAVAGAIVIAGAIAVAIMIKNPGGIRLAEERQFQWHVQVNGKDKCGGISIAPDWILTAAHCMNTQKQRMEVLTGNKKLNEGVPSLATHVILHDSFPENWEPTGAKLSDDSPLNFDIALVKINTHASPGALSTIVRAEASQVSLYTDAFVSGWICSSDVIDKMKQWVPFAGGCGHMLAYTDLRPSMTPQSADFCVNHDMFICAEGPLGKRAGFDVGDSGGGLTTGTVDGAKAIGMAIYVHPKADVYLRLSSFKKWISDCMLIPPVTAPITNTSPTKYYKCKEIPSPPVGPTEM